MNRDQERLFDILEALSRIEKYSSRGREAFDSDELLQSHVLHHLQIAGEASRSLSDAFKQQHAQVPWERIVRLRHVIVHDYFKIDLEILWSVVERDVPGLKRQVELFLNEFPTD